MNRIEADRSLVLSEAILGRSAHGFAVNVLLAAAGSLALTVSAKLSVPFFPVPMTFQTMVVLLIGLAYGPRLAAATVALYLAQGAIGLPVFAGTPERGVGLAYMAGPTGGFLAGFLLAAVVAGALARRGWSRSIPSAALAMVAGTFAIYLPGLLWLGTVVGWDKPVLDYGLWPFIYGDLLKLALAAVVAPAAWKLVARFR